MFVKICGTTNLEDAKLAVQLGADALGFIFAPSKRRVGVEQVAEITRQLPPHVLRVGVFTEPDTEQIVQAVRAAGLGGVQMHWAYASAPIRSLRDVLGDSVLLWQVVGFNADPLDREQAETQFTAELAAAMLDPEVHAVLLDSVKAGKSGGMGEAFSWRRARPLTEAVRSRVGKATKRLPHLVIAGGLRPDNVREAIDTLQPWGVDVVSGVEASPGRKSPDRLREFISVVKKAG